MSTTLAPSRLPQYSRRDYIKKDASQVALVRPFARVVRHTDAFSGVACGPMVARSALMLPHLARTGPPQPRYHLVLQALPDGVPAPVRLRRLLKALLRGYGFRCLAAEEVVTEEEGAARGVLPDPAGGGQPGLAGEPEPQHSPTTGPGP